MRIGRYSKTFLMLLVVVLVAGACGGDGEGAVTTAAPATTTAAPTTTTTSLSGSTATTAVVATVTEPSPTTSVSPEPRLRIEGPALVAHFPLDGDGENLVAVTSDWDGKVVGAFPTEDRHGVPDGAMWFDASAQARIEVGGTGAGPASVEYGEILNTQAVTLAAWVRVDPGRERTNEYEPPPGDWYWPDWWGAVASFEYFGHLIGVQGHGGLYGSIQGDGVCAYESEGFEVLDGEWHHIAMTIEADGATTFYLDGTPRPSRRVKDPWESQITWDCPRTARFLNVFWIGGCPVYGEHFPGAIDDVRIYNYPLSQEEITELAAS